MVPPLVINIFSQDSEMRAPADIARRLIKAIVGIFALKIASLIWVAASNRPPKVSISKIITFALSFSAISILRSINGGRPKSIVS